MGPRAGGAAPWCALAMAVLSVGALAPLMAPCAAAGPDSAELVWEGDVYLNETLVVQPGQTLVIRPGTRVHLRGVPLSCTEENLPLLAVNGTLLAQGTPELPVVFESGGDPVNCSGREAIVIYTVDRNVASVISNARFLNGTLMLSAVSVAITNTSFNGTFVELWRDRSLIENCTLDDSPVYIYHESSTIVRECTLRRTARDEVGIHPAEGVGVLNNTFTGCLFGVEAPIWIDAEVRGNLFSGCEEGIHSLGNLTVENNTFTDNEVGMNSTGAQDRVRGNLFAGNEVGVVTFGNSSSFVDNNFSAVKPNLRADIRQMLMAQGKVVDGNGLDIQVPMRILDGSGAEVYSGRAGLVYLDKYERGPGAIERRNGPFIASANFSGEFNTTLFDGFFQTAFVVRLELLPELSVEGLSGARAGLHPGDVMVLNVTIANLGPVAAAGFELTLSIDGKPLFRRQVRSLSAGEERSYEFRWTTEKGSHRFTASVDPGGQVRETLETDNQKAASAEVLPAPALPPPMDWLMLLFLIGAGGAAMAAGRK